MNDRGSKLVLEIIKAGNGYALLSSGLDNDNDFLLAETEEEARLYLESWVTQWFEANKISRLREV